MEHDRQVGSFGGPQLLKPQRFDLHRPCRDVVRRVWPFSSRIEAFLWDSTGSAGVVANKDHPVRRWSRSSFLVANRAQLGENVSLNGLAVVTVEPPQWCARSATAALQIAGPLELPGAERPQSCSMWKTPALTADPRA